MAAVLRENPNINIGAAPTIQIIGAQEENEKGRFATCFSTTPAIPGQFYNYRGKEGHKWVKAHPKEYQLALGKVMQGIQHVSYYAFSIALGESIKLFEQQLKKSGGDSYVVLVEPNKSNLWVAELAYNYLSIKPSAVFRLGDKAAKHFISYLDQAELKNDQIPRNIVLFDDACYSGTQVTEHATALFKELHRTRHVAAQIFFVVPFMTKFGREKLETECKTYANYLHVASHTTMQTVSEYVGPAHTKTLNELWYKNERDGTSSRTLHYFDHKVPNSASFPEAISRGTLHAVRKEKQEKEQKSKNAAPQERAKGKAKKQDKKEENRFAIIPSIKPPYKEG